MKIAAIDTYGAAYTPLAIYARCYFNGVEVNNVVYADEESGRVDQYVMDERGNLVIDGDHVRLQTRFGVVRLVFPDKPEIEAQLRKERHGLD